MSQTTSRKTGSGPFETDLDYLMAEFAWVKARSKRIGIQRDLEDSPLTRPRRGKSVQQPDCDCKLASALEVEHTLRAEINVRREHNRKHGPALGLDLICQRNGLTDGFERTLLLLACISPLGSSQTAEFLADSTTMGLTSTTDADGVLDFLEASASDRYRALVALLPESALYRCGLIQFGYRLASPSDLTRAGIELRWKTFAEIIGIPEYAAVPEVAADAGGK